MWKEALASEGFCIGAILYLLILKMLALWLWDIYASHPFACDSNLKILHVEQHNVCFLDAYIITLSFC